MRAQLIKDSAERYEWTIIADGEQGFRGMLDTENARDLLAYDVSELRELRFHRLTFGRRGDDAHQIVDMELIWLAALIKAGWSSVNHLVRAVGAGIVWSTAPKPWSDWDDYEWVARQCGVDFMIDAYLDGVPLEHVLADVEFLPDRELLEYWFFPSNSVNFGPITSVNFSNIQPVVYPSYTQAIANHINKQVMSLGA
jgi:hypothetical protein